jgi:hypothetical protein
LFAPGTRIIFEEFEVKFCPEVEPTAVVLPEETKAASILRYGPT